MFSLVVVFLISLFSDLLSCEWQSARERGQLVRIAALGAVIEAMSWFPIFVAVFTEDLWLVVAGVLGAVLGGVWGAERERRRQDLPEAARSTTSCTCFVANEQAETVPIGKNTFANREIVPPEDSDRPDRECRRPPPGWRCTRGHHEDGPCAAVPE